MLSKILLTLFFSTLSLFGNEAKTLKEIVVIESKNCPYCEKFDQAVVEKYHGTIPLKKIDINQKDTLTQYTIHTKIDATPQIFFFENKIEKYTHKGYLEPKEFYKLVGVLKLGQDSESYRVAFNKGTDNRYCKQYEIFKDTGDGIFVDKLSGDPLFDTKDRFNSGTGWLSFYKPVDGAVSYKKDTSHGMIRTEVLAKKSGIHLGHVFDRYDGKKRYCINATVLEFIPRENLSKK